MEKYPLLKKVLQENPSRQKIVITTHQKPDGDALGSTLALGMLCRSLGHQVAMISPTILPGYLKWVANADQVSIAEKEDKEKTKRKIVQADIIFCLDIGEYHRLGMLASWIREHASKVITIDHHPGLDESIAKLTISEPTMSATAIILYDLFIKMGLEKYITQTIATYLYLGIFTDTGCFTNSNTNAKVHRTVAKLIEKGVATNLVSRQLQGNTPLNKLRFTAHVITNRLSVNARYGFSYIAIPSKDFLSFKLQSGDTGGIINYALNIQGISRAVLLTEQKNGGVNLSFRSLGEHHVNRLAQKHFQGGGHKNAAGGTSKLTLKETVAKLEKVLTDNAKKISGGKRE
ncbi:MAG: DHH family phosphoesterase [Cytophagales bacterium]